MFGKVFAQCYTGSMMGAGALKHSVWNYAIVHCTNGSVELNPKLMAVLIGESEGDISSAIESFCQPDPKSRSKEEEGRKLIREGEYQYRMVNWQKYHDIRNEEDRKEQNRINQAAYRERQKARNRGKPSPKEVAALKALKNGDVGTYDRLTAPSSIVKISPPLDTVIPSEPVDDGLPRNL